MNWKREVYHQLDRQKREDMIRDHLPMVYQVARRIAGTSAMGTLELGDLVNVGVLGLYRALDRYDETNGVPFGAFATHFVRGGMLDELGKHRQIPRGLREKQARVNKCYDTLSQQLLREPNDLEMAAFLDITVDELNRWFLDLGWTSAFSLEELEMAGGLNTVDPSIEQNPSLAFDWKEGKALMVQAIKRLSSREQQVLWAYFEEELTLKEIAYVLDLSESQVSRIRTKAIARLRGMLSRQKTDVQLK